MPLADGIQPLSPTIHSYLQQQEVDLNALSLEVDDGVLSLIFPGGDKKPLTEKGFASLCRVIQVPLGFGKRLKEDGCGHVLSYLQKQLSQSYLREPAIIVTDVSTNTAVRASAGHVLAVTTKSHILPALDKILELDAEILKVAKEYSRAHLRARIEVDGTLRYGFMTKKGKVSADSSEYEFGHVFTYSLLGLEQPQLYQVAIRTEDLSSLTLPFKPVVYEVSSPTFMGDLIAALETLGSEGWGELEAYLGRLKGVNASLKEVKDTRQKLTKALKIDKEDKETAERLEQFFGWKKLIERYDIKSLSPKPSKKWLMSASSHLNLLDVYLKLISETTHAPNTLEHDIRLRLEKYASKMMGRLPDLAEKEPPKVQWS